MSASEVCGRPNSTYLHTSAKYINKACKVAPRRRSKPTITNFYQQGTKPQISDPTAASPRLSCFVQTGGWNSGKLEPPD